jgi:hypothetical protein
VLGSSWLPRQSSTWQPDDSFSVTWQLNDTTEVGDGQTQCGVVSINSASESDIAPAFVHPCGVHFYLYLPSEAAVEAPLILFW